LPSASPGIGFDDLRWSPVLKKLIIPAGRAGYVALVDPDSLAVDTLPGFSTSDKFEGGHDFGATSADSDGKLLFVTDRTANALVVVDLATKQRTGKISLAHPPDYARVAPSGDEVWVSEPDGSAIEVFTSGATPAKKVEFAVPGGPESLEFDKTRGRAYAHLWRGETVAIDVAKKMIVATWKNGCTGSRGLALDETRGFLFAVCKEGKVSVLDVAHDGKILGAATHGGGFDVSGYDPNRRRLYAAGGQCACAVSFDVSEKGDIAFAAEKPASASAHCAATDAPTAGVGRSFYCDPARGTVVRIDDTR
jgi:hypothetical protein